MNELYNCIGQCISTHTKELHEKVIAHLKEHRMPELYLDFEKAGARLEEIVSMDENLKTLYADFKTKRDRIFKTDNIRRQLDQMLHNKK